MKKLYLVLLCGMLLLSGCNNKDDNEENKNTPPKKDDTLEVTKDAAIISAKAVITAAKTQYKTNILNKTYEAYGRVGDLPIDKVYVGMWNYDEELEDIVIRDVEIDGYVCSGSLTTVDCTKK